jgi:DNA gyrase subunit A
LVDDVPRVLPLRDFLEAYLKHQQEIITRRAQFLLRRARERAHLVEGLLIALSNIDRIIALIRGSADVEKAREGLMQEFSLSEEQARAILEMRLQRLTALERHKLEDEHRSLVAEIEHLETLLADEKLILQEIRQDLLEIKKKYGDKRRTKIVPDEGEINLEDLIEDEEVVITLTRDGYIKRLPLNTYRSQGRGGVGIRGHSIRESDLIENLFISSTRDKLLFFCSRGKVFPLKVYEIPEAGRQARGTAIVNLLPLENGEYITAVFPLREYGAEDHIIMATQKGIVKRTSLSEYAAARRFGLIAINLLDGDELITVRQLRNGEADAEQDLADPQHEKSGKSEEEPDICIATAQGLLIRFSAAQLRTLGRTARGVKGINLSPGDTVIGMNIVSPAEKSGFLFVTENGYAKRTEVEKFRAQNRGGKGLLAFKYKKREGLLVSFLTVHKKEEIMAITARGLIMRAKISQVPFQGRYARGVTLIRLAPEDKVVKIAAVTKE